MRVWVQTCSVTVVACALLAFGAAANSDDVLSKVDAGPVFALSNESGAKISVWS